MYDLNALRARCRPSGPLLVDPTDGLAFLLRLRSVKKLSDDEPIEPQQRSRDQTKPPFGQTQCPISACHRCDMLLSAGGGCLLPGFPQLDSRKTTLYDVIDEPFFFISVTVQSGIKL
jgi:hypothetical protein